MVSDTDTPKISVHLGLFTLKETFLFCYAGPAYQLSILNFQFSIFELAAGEVEHLADLFVEFAGGAELFQGEMHAVAPVVVGIGRNVDALRCGVLGPERAAE